MMDRFPPAWRDLWQRWDVARRRRELIRATAFLTRLPLPLSLTSEPAPPPPLARASWAFPVVGLGLGLLGGLAYRLAWGLGLPTAAAALLAVLATVLLTGALHEDGLADTADGLGGGRDKAAKLRIMRDSRSGAFGVLALIFSIGLRWAALTALATPGAVATALIAAHVAARAFLPPALRWLDPARADGLGAAAGRPASGEAGAALAIGALLSVAGLGFGAGLVALIAAALAATLLAALARRQIGGYTGDVLGALEQVGETTMLLAAAALLSP